MTALAEPVVLPADQHHAYLRWHEITGQDSESELWAEVRESLRIAHLACEQVPAPAADGCEPSTAAHGRRLQIAVIAAAHYAMTATADPVHAELAPEAPAGWSWSMGDSVLIALALLAKPMPGRNGLAGLPIEDAAVDLAGQLADRALDIYPSAYDALAASVELARDHVHALLLERPEALTAEPPAGTIRDDEQQTETDDATTLLPPHVVLVDTVLRELDADDVFTEHVCLAISRDGVSELGYACLTPRKWLVYRNAP